MSPLPQPQNAANEFKLADALDRLAGALEQQTRTLLELRDEVSGLAGTLGKIESRLDALEARPSAVPGPIKPDATANKPKPAAKKRPK